MDEKLKSPNATSKHHCDRADLSKCATKPPKIIDEEISDLIKRFGITKKNKKSNRRYPSSVIESILYNSKD